MSKKPEAAERATKLTQPDRLEAMLRTEGGVTMLEITGALGVQAHSARAMISGLRKKRQLDIELADGKYRVNHPTQ
jgi:predicted transcriptional regulator of viral defense system